MAAVALICMTMTCVVFTACNKDNDETTSIVYYRAYGNAGAFGADISETLSNLECLGDYTAAIGSVAKDYDTVSKDNEVIAACDKVYNTHRTEHPSWKGTITVYKYRGIDGNNRSVLKTYEYN